MSSAYELRNGSYYLFDLSEAPSRLTGERTIRLMTDEVAIAFDRDTGTLHKHGAPERVDAWAATARQAYRDSGFDEQAAALVVISGAFPVDEINACLAGTGHVLKLFDRLQRGEVSSAKAPVSGPATVNHGSKGHGPANSAPPFTSPTGTGSDGSRRSVFPARR